MQQMATVPAEHFTINQNDFCIGQMWLQFVNMFLLKREGF